jgi:hypothetical protein
MTTSLTNLSTALKGHYDIFIASASYESRCLSIVNAIDNKIKFSHKFVSASVPHIELINENLSIFTKKGFSRLDINNSKQLTTANNILSAINDTLKDKPESSFLIDITTFTKQTLLILLRLLRNVLNTDNAVQFLYTPASDYSIGLPYEEKWLTKGVLGVNSVLGYSGIIRPSRPYHLIILLGYEVERASALINAYEPSKITIGYARKSDSISSDHYDLNKQKFIDLVAEFPHAEAFEFSCSKIEECKTDILQQAQKYTSYNVIVSPMNNKISTISSALAAFENKDIQVAIAIPAIYNYENYSEPSANCNVLEVPSFIKNK